LEKKDREFEHNIDKLTASADADHGMHERKVEESAVHDPEMSTEEQ